MMKPRDKKILVTGGAGYIGSVLTKRLLDRGYLVRVVDWLRQDDKALPFFSKNPRLEFIKGDLREDAVQKKALKGVNAAIHLAAIVGDPACKREPELAEEVNWHASKSIFDRANKMGLNRFIFASTCSNYGKMPDSEQYIDETGFLNPISWYAQLKVKFEKYLLSKSLSSMVCTSLRFATAYGVSPRMRFDLTVNEFVREVVLGRELVVYGEKFWRPYAHIGDLARSCICALEADKELVDRDVFNVGDTKENYQKQTIVNLIRKRLPEMSVRFVEKNEDPRNYKVSFNKIKERLKFKITRTIADSIDELIESVRSRTLKK